MYKVTIRSKGTPYADSSIMPLDGRDLQVRWQCARNLEFKVNEDPVFGGKQTMFDVATENEANALANYLATELPGTEVSVSKIMAIYQSDRPSVKRKIVTERGVLPG